MKRLIVVLCVLGFIVALPMLHSASAARPEPKVPICHVNSGNDILELDGVLYIFGKEIEVSENAVETHVTQHGDSVWPNYETFDKATRNLLEETFEIKLPNANCVFPYLPEPQPEPGPE